MSFHKQKFRAEIIEIIVSKVITIHTGPKWLKNGTLKNLCPKSRNARKPPNVLNCSKYYILSF